MGLKYVMVTSWENHWDRLPNNETYYTIDMLKPSMSIEKLKNNTPTVFIKLNKKSRKPEKLGKDAYTIFALRELIKFGLKWKLKGK